jgi:hypothetical protein
MLCLKPTATRRSARPSARVMLFTWPAPLPRTAAAATATLCSTLLCAGLSWPYAARADDAQCLRAYEEGQVLQQQGQLTAAIRALDTCARRDCPELVSHDCASWVSEITAELASVVLRISDARGRSVWRVRVYADGEPVAARSDQPLTLDPGTHHLRFDADGYLSSEVAIELRRAEKDHHLTVRLLARSAVGAEPVRTEERQVSSPPYAAYAIAGAVTATGLATFAGFGLAGRGVDAGLAACKPACEPQAAQAHLRVAQRNYLIADLGLSVAISGALVLSYVLLDRAVHGTSAQRTAAADRSGALGWSARF